MIYIQIVIVVFIVVFIGIIRRSSKLLFRLFDSTDDITELKARQVILLVGVIIGLSLFVMGLVVLFMILVGESSKL